MVEDITTFIFRGIEGKILTFYHPLIMRKVRDETCSNRHSAPIGGECNSCLAYVEQKTPL